MPGSFCLIFKYGYHLWYRWSLLYLWCLPVGTTEVMEKEVNVEIHSAKVSMLTYTVSVGGLPEANVNQLKPCLNMI